MDYLLILDDTGLGGKKNSKHLQDRITSTCGYLIPTHIVQDFGDDVQTQIYYLKQDYGADEFHFTEMYNRKNKFKDFTADGVLNYIAIFRDIVMDYDLKIITQSITKSFKEEHPEIFEGLDIIVEDLNLAHNRDEAYCLLLNIMFAKKYLKDNGKGDDKLVGVVCDEGLRKNGAEVIIKSYDNLPIEFMSSKNCPHLQVADFCAWAKSRVEQTVDKYQGIEMKDFEQRVLKNLEPMQKNYANLKLATTNVQKGINLDDTVKRLK